MAQHIRGQLTRSSAVRTTAVHTVASGNSSTDGCHGRLARSILLALALLLVTCAFWLESSASAQTVAEHSGASSHKHAGYLFAHMTKEDYGRLYYSVSRDGLRWRLLNGGKRVLGESYRGHPDICGGHDGRFYLIGNHSRRPEIGIWVSDDLVRWAKLCEFRPDVSKTPHLEHPVRYHGAPKIYYDRPTGQYLITWHTPTEKGDPKDPEKFWASMRTLYVTSKDLTEFTDPKRLFAFEMATIDAIVRRVGDRCYAIIKDERMPSFDWPTGKAMRISSSANLLGPYSEPSPRITANFREAPTLIPRPDGRAWYLYYEQYPGVSYGLSTAPSLDGPWYDVYCKEYEVPEGARHGCMIPITQPQYDAIVAAYGNGEESAADRL